jgi:hypothetical protein
MHFRRCDFLRKVETTFATLHPSVSTTPASNDESVFLSGIVSWECLHSGGLVIMYIIVCRCTCSEYTGDVDTSTLRHSSTIVNEKMYNNQNLNCCFKARELQTIRTQCREEADRLAHQEKTMPSKMSSLALTVEAHAFLAVVLFDSNPPPPLSAPSSYLLLVFL